MIFKFVIFCAALAYTNAGLIGAPAAVAYSPASAVSHAYINQATAPLAYAAPAAYATPLAYAAPSVGATHQSLVRGFGGAQAVSHYSKSIDSPFSSVRKYDTRVTNDAVFAAPVAHAAFAAPVAHAAYAAPVAHAAFAAPVAHAAYAAPVAHAAYAAPLATYARATYSAPVAHAAYAAPVAAYGAPVAAYSAPVVAKTAALAYSPAAVVSHASFSGLGVSYGW